MLLRTTVIHPYPEGASELLKAGTSDTLRFETFVPDGRDSVIDIIKVFATSEAVDFHKLTQSAVRGGKRGGHPVFSNDPLGRLLEQAALGISRGSRPKSVKLGHWGTAKRIFKVKR